MTAAAQPPAADEDAGAAGRGGAAEPATDATGATPNVRRALGLSLRTSLAVQIIGSISGIELARGLGVNDRGALAAAMLWSLVAGNVGALGIEQATTYYVAREPKASGRLIGSGLVLCAIQSAAFGLLTLAIIPLVLSKQPDDVVVSALIYSLYIPLNMFAVMLNAVLNGLHRYSWANGVRLAVSIAVITVQTALLIMGEMSVRLLVIGFTCCYLANLLLVVFLIRRARPGRISWDRPTTRKLFAYGIRSHASTVPAALNQNLDQLLISAFLTTSQLGVYVVAVTMTSFTALIGGSVAYATLPNVAALPEGPQRAVLARRLTSLTLVVSAAISLPLIALTPRLLRLLFGEGFVEGTDVARILLVAAIALSTNRALEGVLRGLGKPLEAGLAEIVALGATCVALAVLLPTIGLIGAGLASLVAYLVAMVYMVQRTTRTLGITPMHLVTPDRESLAALAALAGKVMGKARASRAA